LLWLHIHLDFNAVVKTLPLSICTSSANMVKIKRIKTSATFWGLYSCFHNQDANLAKSLVTCRVTLALIFSGLRF
jgi:hypothetical protein